MKGLFTEGNTYWFQL